MKLTVALLLALVVAPAADAQNTTDAQQVFSGQVANGAWLRIRAHKGTIRVNEAAGNTATVTARTRYRSSSYEEVTYEVKRDGPNVTVCSITSRTRRCDDEGYDSRGGRSDREEGSSDFTVSLPRGVRLLASTGNGDVDVRNAGAEVKASSGNGEVNVSNVRGRVSASSGNGDILVDRAEGDVEASSGNGDIRVSTSKGPVSASSGNGRIDVSMQSLSGDDDMSFSTGNGSITVAFPSNLSARIDASGAFRNFETDFPIDMGRGWSSNRVQGTIGSGSRRIRLSTGNGRITLRKI
jgi:hypothetical protein